MTDNCCVTDYFAWESPGIGRNVVFLLGMGVVFLLILTLKEFRLFHRLFYKVQKNYSLLANESSFMDDDVIEEKYRVRNMNYNQIRSHNLVLKNMTKFYNDFVAVNQICVAVES